MANAILSRRKNPGKNGSLEYFVLVTMTTATSTCLSTTLDGRAETCQEFGFQTTWTLYNRHRKINVQIKRRSRLCLGGNIQNSSTALALLGVQEINNFTLVGTATFLILVAKKDGSGHVYLGKKKKQQDRSFSSVLAYLFIYRLFANGSRGDKKTHTLTSWVLLIDYSV